MCEQRPVETNNGSCEVLDLEGEKVLNIIGEVNNSTYRLEIEVEVIGSDLSIDSWNRVAEFN